MNFPAIAKQTYEELKGLPVYLKISEFIIEHLKKISSPLERARFIHNVVDDYNQKVFAHPIVQKLMPCKSGCSGCCHTQVSITDDEAELLISRINEGVKVDYSILQNQMKAANSSEEFYRLSYEARKCIFLGENNKCQVYKDRPSVCRTNAVLGEASQCSTKNGLIEGQQLRLVKTSEADMAIIGSFMNSKENGTLAHMIGRKLFISKTVNLPKANKALKKSIFNDQDL